jgi:hypothetical protein
MSKRLHINHYAEAERCLSQAAYRTGPDGPFSDPETAQLLISQAQAHATLATLPDQLILANESAKELEAERNAFHRVIVGHVFEALMSDSLQVQRFARSIAQELDAAGVNIDMDIWDRSVETGHGPEHYTVDGVVYQLSKQVVDRDGTVWEHTGRWTSNEEPVMRSDLEDVPSQSEVPLPELVENRGPLAACTPPTAPF